MRFLLVVGLCAGCAGPVVSKVKVTPPAPVAAPVEAPGAEGDEPPESGDSDGDGVVGSADRCPQKGETKNGHQDDDGCPDEAPAFRLDGNEVAYVGEITFAAGGRLAKDAGPVLDGIAGVLNKHAEIDLVEVGVHLVGDKPSDAEQVTRLRAASVVDALAERGVDKARMRAAGYGARCGVEGRRGTVRIDLRVVEKAGEKTGVTLGCSP